MGYTTDFDGEVTIEPPLNQDEIDFLTDFNQTRRMHRSGGPLYVKGEGPMGQGHGPDQVHDHNQPGPDQPGLWCQWVPSDDGTFLEWDGGEKFYHPAEWMDYIVNKLLSPASRSYVDQHLGEDERLKNFTCNHFVNGEIYADGEDADDNWKLKVTNNIVEVVEFVGRYADEEPEVAPPSESELKEAFKSLGAKTTAQVKVWTLTTDLDGIVTTVSGNEQEPYDTLKANFTDAEDEDFDVTTEEGRGALIDYLTEKQGVVLYIEEHTVEVEV